MPKNMRVVFGANLKRTRQAAGMTQAAVAEAASGITQAFVSQVEAGGNVTLETMERLAEAVGASVPDLLRPLPKEPRRRGRSTVPPRL